MRLENVRAANFFCASEVVIKEKNCLPKKKLEN